MSSLKFGPDDEAAFRATADGLVAGFSATEDGAEVGWVAEQLLEFKWGHLDGDLADWSADHLIEVLLELYPRKVVLEAGDEPVVIAGFAAFLRFLAADGLLAAERAEELARLIERLKNAFVGAMRDESRWGMGKRLFGAMSSEGVKVDDEAELAQWMAEFNTRPLAERDALLGRLPLPAGGQLVGPLPPVALAADEVLNEAARGCVWLTRVRQLVGFVGDGRPLTDRSNLKLADGKALVELLGTADLVDEEIGDQTWRTTSSAELTEVDLTFALAVAADALSIDGRKVVRGEHADLLDGQPREAWYGLFLALLHRVGLVSHRLRGQRYGFDWAEDLDAELPAILLGLYRDQQPAELADVAEEVWNALVDDYDLEGEDPQVLDVHRRLVVHALRDAVDRLTEFGVLAVDWDDEPAGGSQQAGSLALTELGVWALQRIGSRVTDAPVIGALVDADASTLLSGCVDLPEPNARAEIDHWVARHGEQAAELLAEAIRTVGETARALGFRALLRVGPKAAEAVSRLADDERLAPYVTVWRVDALLAASDEMHAVNDEQFIRLLHAVLDLWGPHAVTGWTKAAAGDAEPASVFEHCWRVDLPETEAVLAAIGSYHDDKVIAKAARKGLFRYRSRHSTGSE